METKEELLKTYNTAKAELKEWEEELEKNPSEFNQEKVEEFELVVSGLKYELDNYNKSKEVNPIEEFFSHLKTQIKEPKKIYIARCILTESYAPEGKTPEETILDVKIDNLLEIATLKETLKKSLSKNVIIDDITELEVR